MEPEFGRFFLSNFRNASLPASSSHQLYPLEATESPKPVPLPPLQRTCDTESTTPGSSGLFRLAPPPPNQFAVGVRTSGEQVVKIETLQEQKAAPSISKAEEPEDYGPTGAVFVDDEEGLLGDDVPKSPSGVPPAGATRDFESDDEDEAMAPQEQAPPPVEAPVELPPPQPLKGVEREEVEPEREKPEVEEGVEATAVATPQTLPMQAAPAASPAAASAPPRHPPSVPSEAAPAAEAVFEVPHPVLSPVHAGAHALRVPRMTMEMAPIETAEPPAPPRPIMPGQVQTFRISVPPPFPGVQIRKSTNIEDKHDRFLQDGKEVRGKVDASGQWVKLKSKHYLPVKVGNIQVLHVLDPKEPAAATLSPEVVPVPVEEDETNFWFTCCAGSAAVAEGNDLHVTPEDRGNYGTLDGSGDVLTPVVLSNGKVAHTFPQPPSSGTRSGAPKAVPNRAQAGVVDLPRHISNPIDPFSDR